MAETLFFVHKYLFLSPRPTLTPFKHSYGMPKAKNWQWNHFHGGEMHNKAFKKAYCIYCVRVKQKEIMALDELAYREGRIAALRHQEEQFNDGM